MLKTLKLFSLSFLALAVIACVATPTNESAGEYLDSSTVTAKVKANLVDTLGTDGFAVVVKTYKHDVQLSGFVNSAIIKQRAGIIAAHTVDVRRVRNDLIVK